MTAAAATDANAIEARGVVKRYGTFTALDDATLRVPSGTIFGFLGPNGAGKTTLLRLLVGLTRTSDGELRVLGRDPWRERTALHEQLGYVPSGMGFYERQTGRELLDYTASLMHGEARTSPLRGRVLDALGLDAKTLDRPVRDYSKGMRQKLAIAQGMQHDPPLLLLDEPSDGLDPLVQHAMYDLLRDRRDAGRTIFFSSHTLSEVQALCDHVAIIRRGTVVTSSTYAELAKRQPRVVRISGLLDADRVLGWLGEEWSLVQRDGNDVVLHTRAEPMTIVRELSRMELADVTIEPASLEDVFLEYYRSDGA